MVPAASSTCEEGRWIRFLATCARGTKAATAPKSVGRETNPMKTAGLIGLETNWTKSISVRPFAMHKSTMALAHAAVGADFA